MTSVTLQYAIALKIMEAVTVLDTKGTERLQVTVIKRLSEKDFKIIYLCPSSVKYLKTVKTRHTHTQNPELNRVQNKNKNIKNK